MQDEVFAVFLWNKRITTMRTTEFHRREAALIRGESGITDLTEKLPFAAVILIKIRFRGITARTGTEVVDITFGTSADRPDLLAVAFLEVRNKFFISPVLTKIGDQRKFINLEFLIFGRMGIVISPLLKRDIPANEVDKPAVLLVKVLNNRK